jgi:hypothetical protein
MSNERLVVLTFEEGEVGITLGANYRYTSLPYDLTVVYVAASPSADDAGATIDINDDGTGVITGVDISDQNVPGEWRSVHQGGANAPVTIDAGSLLSIDANDIDAGTRVRVDIWGLVGEVSA